MPISIRAAGASLLVLTTSTLFVTAPRAQQKGLLTPVLAAPIEATAFDRREKAFDKAIVESEFVRVDATALRRQATSNFHNLGLRMFGKDHILEFDRAEKIRQFQVLYGQVRGRPGDAIFVVAPNGLTYGTIHLVEESFVLVHSTADDVHVLQRVEESRRNLPCGCKANHRIVLPAERSKGAPENPTATLLDVAMFYTPKAKAASGGSLGMEAMCASAIAQANATNRRSGANIEFRLVYVAETKFTEDGTGKDLARFRNPSDGYMDEVHKARTTFGADMMHLITQPAKLSYCGVAYLMGSLSSGFQKWCFGVTVRSCMGGNVVAHELGHNMGCHHDRGNAGGAIYPHAYGFRTADKKYRTVMAYSPGSRVNLWSSPKNKHLTYVMGKTNSEDNVATIEKTKATISKFRAGKAVIFCQTKGAIAGKFGQIPEIYARGTINSTYPPKITISKQWYFSPGLIVMGATDVNIPYFGGILVPAPQAFASLAPSFHPIELDATGLSKLPKGASLWFQVLFADSAAVQGLSATNGMKIVIP